MQANTATPPTTTTATGPVSRKHGTRNATTHANSARPVDNNNALGLSPLLGGPPRIDDIRPPRIDDIRLIRSDTQNRPRPVPTIEEKQKNNARSIIEKPSHAAPPFLLRHQSTQSTLTSSSPHSLIPSDDEEDAACLSQPQAPTRGASLRGQRASTATLEHPTTSSSPPTNLNNVETPVSSSPKNRDASNRRKTNQKRITDEKAKIVLQLATPFTDDHHPLDDTSRSIRQHSAASTTNHPASFCDVGLSHDQPHFTHHEKNSSKVQSFHGKMLPSSINHYGLAHSTSNITRNETNTRPGAVTVANQNSQEIASTRPGGATGIGGGDNRDYDAETLISAQAVCDETPVVHAVVATSAPATATPENSMQRSNDIDPVTDRKANFVISRRCCWMILVVMIMLIGGLGVTLGFMFGSRGSANSSPSEDIAGSVEEKCTFCYGDDASSLKDVQLVWHSALVSDNQLLSCVELRNGVESLEANDNSCQVGQAFSWKHCGCPRLPPSPPDKNGCPMCGKFNSPTSATPQCEDELRYVQIVGTDLPSFCPTLVAMGESVCTCPVAATDPPRPAVSTNSTEEVELVERKTVSFRSLSWGDGTPAVQPVNAVLSSTDTAAPVSVLYVVTWRAASTGCNGFPLALTLSCGTGGFIGTPDQQGTSLVTCQTSLDNTMVCSSDFGLTATAVFDDSVSFVCSGGTRQHLQGTAEVSAQENVVCDGIDAFVTQGVGISYYDIEDDLLVTDSTCLSGSETDDGLCYSTGSCGAAGCSTVLSGVGARQNTPIPANAHFQPASPAGAPTPAPTIAPLPVVCMMPSQAIFRLELLTDSFPQETDWNLRRLNDDTVVAAPVTPLAARTAYTWRGCVDAASCYRWTITDSAGDGLCCGFGIGNYTLIYNNQTVQTGAEFGRQESALIGSNCNLYTP